MRDELDELIRDANMLTGNVFRLIHGDNVHRVIAPDNSVRIYSVFKEPVAKPYVKSRAEHKTPPRKDDMVIIEDTFNETEEWGRILWVNREDDTVGIFKFKNKEYETFSYSELESVFGKGKARWRYVQ